MEDVRDNLNELVQLERDNLADLLGNNQIEQFKSQFLALHVYEMGQIYAELPSHLRPLAWQHLSITTLSDIFDNIDEDESDIVALFSELPAKLAAKILQTMYTDNASNLLSLLSPRQIATYLSLFPKEAAEEMRLLIGFEDQTAGGLMTTDYLAVLGDLRVDEVMHLVKQQAQEAEIISYVYVLDDEDHLIGVVSLRDLLIHRDDLPITSITTDRVIAVHAGDDQEMVAQIVADYNFMSIPVTDDDEHLLGIITVDDIIDVLDEEATEDYSGLAAVDVSDTNDSALHSAFKRIPWLIALLLLGMITATVINSFDGLIKQASILAVFVSLITGTAGNARTQSLALAVRRIATNENNHLIKTIFFEMLSGLITGMVTGIAVYVLVYIWHGNLQLSLAVGLAMMSAIFVANMAGLLVPVMMNKVGVDPAVASGPFISTLSDLTSVVIYFSIAQVFIQQFVQHT